jgi:hypothetical protein
VLHLFSPSFSFSSKARAPPSPSLISCPCWATRALPLPPETEATVAVPPPPPPPLMVSSHFRPPSTPSHSPSPTRVAGPCHPCRQPPQFPRRLGTLSSHRTAPGRGDCAVSEPGACAPAPCRGPKPRLGQAESARPWAEWLARYCAAIFWFCIFF